MKALLFSLFTNKYVTTQVSCLNLFTLKQKYLPDLWWIHLVDGSHRLVCMNFHEGSVCHKLAVTKPIVVVKSSQILAVWSKRANWHYETLPAMLLICTEACSPGCEHCHSYVHTHARSVPTTNLLNGAAEIHSHQPCSVREIKH